MSRLRKYFLYIAIFILFLLLTSYYLFSAPKICTVYLGSKSEYISAHIKDKAKWKEFIGKLAECKSGFSVFIPPQTTPVFVKLIQFEITDEVQPNQFKSSDKTVLYSYSYSLDSQKNQAIIKLNFPSKDEIAKKLHSAIFLTIYSLLKGVSYDKPQSDFLSFTTLENMGISYETR